MVLILFYLTYYALARYKCNTFNNNDHYNPNVKTYKSFIQIIRYRLLLLLLLLLLLFCCLFLHVDIYGCTYLRFWILIVFLLLMSYVLYIIFILFVKELPFSFLCSVFCFSFFLFCFLLCRSFAFKFVII